MPLSFSLLFWVERSPYNGCVKLQRKWFSPLALCGMDQTTLKAPGAFAWRHTQRHIHKHLFVCINRSRTEGRHPHTTLPAGFFPAICKPLQSLTFKSFFSFKLCMCVTGTFFFSRMILWSEWVCTPFPRLVLHILVQGFSMCFHAGATFFSLDTAVS